MISTPRMTVWKIADTPRWFRPFLRVAMVMNPRSAPIMLPEPPAMLIPPIRRDVRVSVS